MTTSSSGHARIGTSSWSDLERGILLRLSFFASGGEAMSDELLAARFDEPLTEELMRFGQAQ